jgi:hypothetical protein
MKPQASTLAKLAVGMSDIADDVLPPSRARSHSFASVLADMKIGDTPSCRAMEVPMDTTQDGFDMKAALTEAKERLRNNVQSSVNQAKRRVEGAAYSVECKELVADTGLYIIALVRRTA